MSHANQVQRPRQRYATPALTVYGSVRDLTGGISGLNGESMGGMMA